VSIPTFRDDLDRLNGDIVTTFGALTNQGAEWTYTTSAGISFSIDGLFYEAWEQVDIGQGKNAFGSISSTNPLFILRVLDWPAGVKMNKGDMLTSPAGEQFRVENQNLDGAGMIQLSLTKMD
jgi:hypothetical protein